MLWRAFGCCQGDRAMMLRCAREEEGEGRGEGRRGEGIAGEGEGGSEREHCHVEREQGGDLLADAHEEDQLDGDDQLAGDANAVNSL